jgi:hypothetical protein
MKTVTLVIWVSQLLNHKQLKMLKANITDGVPMCALASQPSFLSLGFSQSCHRQTKVQCNHGKLGVKSLINLTLAQACWKHWSDVTHKPCCMVIVVTPIITMNNGI